MRADYLPEAKARDAKRAERGPTGHPAQASLYVILQTERR
jgi:hypothetical protein